MVLAVGGTLFFLEWARAFLVPLAIGLVLAIALDPLVELQRRLHVPRSLAAGVVVIGLWLVGALLTFAMQDKVAAMAARVPVAVERVAGSVDEMRVHLAGALDRVHRMTAAVERTAEGMQGIPNNGHARHGRAADPAPVPATAHEPALSLGNFVWTGSASIFAFAAQLVVVSFLVYFLLVSGRALKRKVVRVAGQGFGEKKRAARMLDVISAQIQFSLLVLFSTNVLMGVLIAVTFALLGMEDAAVWGVVATVLHFVPYLGSVALALASAVGAYLQFGTWSDALIVAGATLLIATSIGTLLATWLQSRAVKVDPCVVYIGLLFWGWLWGVWGLLLGNAITAMVKVVCDHVERLQPVGTLLGTVSESKSRKRRVGRT